MKPIFTSQAARILGKSEAATREAADRGDLPCIRSYRRGIRIFDEDVIRRKAAEQEEQEVLQVEES